MSIISHRYSSVPLCQLTLQYPSYPLIVSAILRYAVKQFKTRQIWQACDVSVTSLKFLVQVPSYLFWLGHHCLSSSSHFPPFRKSRYHESWYDSIIECTTYYSFSHSLLFLLFLSRTLSNTCMDACTISPAHTPLQTAPSIWASIHGFLVTFSHTSCFKVFCLVLSISIL